MEEYKVKDSSDLITEDEATSEAEEQATIYEENTEA